MGEMADMAYEQVEREEGEMYILLCETDEYLFKRSSKAQQPIVKSIRGYFAERGGLSGRQRYVLAQWILQHEF